MKLTLARYLVENENRTPNLGVISRNLEACINRGVFVFRGSESGGDFGEKEARESRNSLTNSNLVLNCTSLYFEHPPSRKRSYFGTNSAHNASDFGGLFVIIPHDSVSKVAIIPNDFNLQENSVLNKIKAGWNLSNFGFTMHAGIMDLHEMLGSDETGRLLTISRKLTHEIDITAQDFEEYDEAFRALFESRQPQKRFEVEDTYDSKQVLFVWEQVSESYDSNFTRFLKAAIKAGQNGVDVLTFDEALQKMGTDELYEIWFEGKCSFFSLDWLNKQYVIVQDDEDASIVGDANSEQDINDSIAEIFKHLLQK